jgi:hypothetical protein
VSGALVPHAPLLLPEVTTEAEVLRELWEGLSRVRIPEGATVVVLTPHAPRGVYARNEGTLAAFGLPDIAVSAPRGDVELDLPTIDDGLDHGALVAMRLFDLSGPVTVVGCGETSDVSDMLKELDLDELFVLASAHTSVRLTERAPLPYSFDAVRLESRFITEIETDCKVAADLADEMWAAGDTCSRWTLRAFGELFGGAEGQVLAYGSPFGVGYPVITAEIHV